MLPSFTLRAIPSLPILVFGLRGPPLQEKMGAKPSVVEEHPENLHSGRDAHIPPEVAERLVVMRARKNSEAAKRSALRRCIKLRSKMLLFHLGYDEANIRKFPFGVKITRQAIETWNFRRGAAQEPYFLDQIYSILFGPDRTEWPDEDTKPEQVAELMRLLLLYTLSKYGYVSTRERRIECFETY